MNASVHVRHEEPSDRDAVWNVHYHAFGGTAEADLVDALREDGSAAISLIAEVDGEVVGHIMFSEVTIRTDKLAIESLSLAPMAVLPTLQRQGIGSALIAAGLEECRKLSHRGVVVLGHPEFYRRFGFSSELASSLKCPFGHGKAWMALELLPQALEGINGRVQYSTPFEMFG